jgi:nicotinate phosphoribosyltransferase
MNQPFADLEGPHGSAPGRDPGASPLLTDFYQLTMLKSYFDHGLTAPAVFEFFVRKLPPQRSFLVAAGLEPVLGFLEGLRFTADELDWLAGRPGFDRAFMEKLERIRFTGDVDAMPEGTVFFPDEPILRVVAPLPIAQLVESRIVCLLHFCTVVASKAARCVLAAPSRQLVDFGLRRAHGAEAGLLAARSAWLAGFDATATVLAGRRYGIPVSGTMAHSYVLAHRSERQAFENFARSWPENATLLIDTYDTERGAARVAEVVPKLAADGIRVNAVRLDSGDLGAHARNVRRILDAAGCERVRIFASGGLDEWELARLADAPIDGFGVGTSLTTSADAPALDCAYKLQEYDGRPCRKRSEGKAHWPGRKQVFRSLDRSGVLERDVLALEGEREQGDALLRPAMRAGCRAADLATLQQSRDHARDQLAVLPARLRRIAVSNEPFHACVSPSLQALARELDAQPAV